MMGRGTRRCLEIHKSHFTVFDCFNGTLLEYFRKITGITAEAPVKAIKTIREIVQAIADNEWFACVTPLKQVWAKAQGSRHKAIKSNWAKSNREISYCE
jgi:type I site-specific restriction endonuclease